MKIFKIFALAAMMFGMVACDNGEETPEPPFKGNTGYVGTVSVVVSSHSYPRISSANERLESTTICESYHCWYSASAFLTLSEKSVKGIVAFSKSIASRYGGDGIRCNVISPGVIKTPMSYVETPNFDDYIEEIENKTPLKRLGNPTDIAKVALFLDSDNSEFITGQEIIVDGGYTLSQE